MSSHAEPIEDERARALPPEGAPGWTGFAAGLKASFRSVLAYALIGTFVGYGGLCLDLGLSVWWAALSTLFIFAAPAQVILVTTLGAGTLVQAALAVTLSAIRLLPMVVALLPMIRGPQTRTRNLILPAHFVAVSMWVESLRLAPHVPREQRVGFCNGIGTGMTIMSVAGTVAGYLLAARLPPTFAAAVLFLTPMMFLVSTARGATMISDRVGFALGLAVTPGLILAGFELALLYGALLGGTLGYAAHRLRRAAA
ncbi:MAG TPA: AzlC family ABC transporter permease [Xanthobacteraceae bacterium]|nr:AzlC family ABC transporter permease [Xanthobacteraceae bacterium]